ncbi:uncharacterized protein LOC117582294 [Drosophila guanche]|uniref:uncharacterized protein LOC117582294 n=1 Tax=Drosophila guanche TaxID=7266 RepID=UPI001471646C|nr:uncharacterized protein LOC117582294 [Drosophila guanche]
MSATIDVRLPALMITHIVRELENVMTLGSQYTRDHIVPTIRSWVIMLHQSFGLNHREAEPVLEMDPLVPAIQNLATIMHDSYSEPDINQPETATVLDAESFLLPMRSVMTIMSDFSPEVLGEQETVVDVNVVVRITQCIYRLARTTYDIMSVLTE